MNHDALLFRVSPSSRQTDIVRARVFATSLWLRSCCGALTLRARAPGEARTRPADVCVCARARTCSEVTLLELALLFSAKRCCCFLLWLLRQPPLLLLLCNVTVNARREHTTRFR